MPNTGRPKGSLSRINPMTFYLMLFSMIKITTHTLQHEVVNQIDTSGGTDRETVKYFWFVFFVIKTMLS